MRITYRDHSVEEYWTSRWVDIPADEPMENAEAYLLKYAEQTVIDRKGNILEVGCGAGRILRFYHDLGMDIVGIDFIPVAIEKLNEIDSTLKVEVGDVTDLRFENGTFKYVLAFGLYHNLEKGLGKSIEETYRVLDHGGSVCASFRADNIQTRLTDWLSERGPKQSKEHKSFHKMNLTRTEFKQAFEKVGFLVDSIVPVENMPLLYKFSFFRVSEHKVFNENLARTEGYRLSWLGQWLQSSLMFLFPMQFCNIFVLKAHKK
jgi:SAM-dependent methyltransferase